jgi:hypothetical protein
LPSIMQSSPQAGHARRAALPIASNEAGEAAGALESS